MGCNSPAFTLPCRAMINDAQQRNLLEFSVHQSVGRAVTLTLSGKFVSSLAVAAIAFFTSSVQNAEAAKLEGRSVKIGCLAAR